MRRKLLIISIIFALCIAIILLFVTDPWKPDTHIRSTGDRIAEGTDTNATEEKGETEALTVTSEIQQVGTATSTNSREEKDRLSPTSADDLEWVVKDCFGKPVASAHIQVVPVSDQIRKEYLDSDDYNHYPYEMKEVFSDASGRFRLDGLSHGTYLLHGDAKGHGHGHALLDLRGPPPERFTLSLTLEKVIRGRVLDVRKKPLTGVLVEISRPYLPFSNLYSIPPEDAVDIVYFHPRQKTDEEGRFEIAGLPKDDLVLTVEEGPAEGYAPVVRWIWKGDKGEQIVYLRKACILHGRVLDKKGKPIAKAFVRHMLPQSKGMDWGKYVFTDEEGRYRFNDVREGLNYIEVNQVDHGNTSELVEILPGRENTKDFVLPDGFRKVLELRDERGNPIPGIDVSVFDCVTGANLCLLKSNDKGQAVMNYLVPGHRNYAYLNYSHVKRYETKSIFFTARDDKPLVVTLKDTIKMHFRCFDAFTRKPIAKVCSCLLESGNPMCVRRPPPFFYKYFDGQEIYWGFTKGDSSLSCWFFAPGYEPYCLLLPKDTLRADPPYDVYLKPGKTLACTVLDSKDLSPVPGASVRLIPVSPEYGLPIRTGQITHTAITDGEGRFTIKGVPSAGYRLEITSPGYSMQIVDGSVLKVGKEPSENVVILEPGATLTGTVRDGEGRIIESCIVQAYSPKGPRLAVDYVDVGGAYMLQGLPAGRVMVEVIYSADGWFHNHAGGETNSWFRRKTVELTPGGHAVLDFIIEGRAWITGTCTRGGEPLPGVLLQVCDPETSETVCTGFTDSYGSYCLSPIPPGRKIVRVESLAAGVGFTVEKEIVVPEEGSVRVDFTFDSVLFQGTIRDEKGKKITGCWLTLKNMEKGKTCTAYTDMEGKYTFSDVPEGPCTLSIAADGYAQKQDEVVLSSAKPLMRDYILAAEGMVRLELKLPSGKLGVGTHAVVVEPAGYTGKTTSNGAGLFVLQNFADGTPVTIVAGGAGYAPVAFSTVVHTGETVEKELFLAEGGWLKVRVRTKEGKPIAGAKVVLGIPGLFGLSFQGLAGAGFVEAEPAGFLTSKEGSFRLGPLPAGSYPVTVIFQGLTWSGAAQIVPGKTAMVMAQF